MTKQYTEMLITPEMAAAMLEKNFEHNRNVRVKIVNQYAADMLNDNWQDTGDAIKFNKSGILMDGQHRLNAIIKANKPMLMTVCYGIGNKVCLYDVGAKRSYSDVFRINNSGSPALLDTRILSAIKKHISYFQKYKDKEAVITKSIEADYKKYKIYWDELYDRCRGHIPSVIYLIYFCALRSGVDADRLKEFTRAYLNNTPMVKPEDTAAWYLRDFLTENTKYSHQINGNAFEIALSIVDNAVFSFVEGKTIKKRYSLKLMSFKYINDEAIRLAHENNQ